MEEEKIQAEKKTYCEILRRVMQEKGYEDDYIFRCLSYAEGLLERDLPVIFDKLHIGQILKMQGVKSDYYSSFYIVGKSGKRRTICAPSRRMKERQRWILEHILEKIQISENCEGFAKGHSIVTNAKKHVGQEYILTVDIQDFFTSITQKQVQEVFMEAGYTEEVSECLAELCCCEGRLPQGAPTSPCIANIVCREMDKELAELAAEKKIIYTRYADDMIFSADTDTSAYLAEITEIIHSHGFLLNDKKTRIQSGPYKLVTGLVVGKDTIRVPKGFKRKLRQEIYYCRKFGVSAHLENSNSRKSIHFKEYLYGKAYYIHMVEPEAGQGFLKELDHINWEL